MQHRAETSHASVYDVIICGGGIAGLGLARQLALRDLGLSVLVLDPLTRPLPEAAFKVGESTIETGAYYLHGTLQLRDHLEAHHLEKLGLRYFYNTGGAFEDRPEYGARRFLPAKSYQVDRGRLENHLRELVVQDGCDLREGARVSDIALQEGETPHVVHFTDAGGAAQTAQGRWVIDAMGRHRMLQHKLQLDRGWRGPCSSVWWRVRGKVSVNDFVSPSHAAWHGRALEDRWQSTNHLMGKGYWVWIIPVAPDNTSIGIVAHEALHPFQSFGTSHARAHEWLQAHEPVLHEALQGHEVMDFMKLRHYSYTSSQVFSRQRWACTGVAGVFADPFYSVGANLIGFSNGFITEMIQRDRQGTLTDEYVDHANRYVITLNDFLTNTIQRGYANLGVPAVAALKTIWDYYIGWTTTDPQFYHETYLDPSLSKIMSSLIARTVVTQGRMMRLFEDWGRRGAATRYTFGYIDYVEDLHTLKALHVRNLPPKTSDFRRLLDNVREGIDRIEEIAHIIFFMAVRDALPDAWPRLASHRWINTEAISLDPEAWERDGLFAPRTTPRDFTAHEAEITRLFSLKPEPQASVA